MPTIISLYKRFAQTLTSHPTPIGSATARSPGQRERSRDYGPTMQTPLLDDDAIQPDPVAAPTPPLLGFRLAVLSLATAPVAN